MLSRSRLTVWATRFISPEGPFLFTVESFIISCGWLAGVILRGNESLIVGKISRALFTARSRIVGVGPAKWHRRREYDMDEGGLSRIKSWCRDSCVGGVVFVICILIRTSYTMLGGSYALLYQWPVLPVFCRVSAVPFGWLQYEDR